MDFAKYQQDVARQMETIDDDQRAEVLLFGLADQAGQVLGNVKKELLGADDEDKDMPERLGDVLWHVAALASWYGYSLEEIAQYNVEKVNGIA